MKRYDLTNGGIAGTLIAFALPYLFSSFMQSLYGAVDVYVIGRFCDAASLSAVNIGGQLMHVITVIILGLAMGTTVCVGQSVGAGDERRAGAALGSSVLLFGIFSAVMTPLMFLGSGIFAKIMNTPPEAVSQTAEYLSICALGIPFISAYNVVSSALRGSGNSRAPMYFIAAACVVNIGGDFLFTGVLGMGVSGVAAATVLAQAVSSIAGIIYLLKTQFNAERSEMKPRKNILREMLKVGVPLAAQDFLVQVSFMVITIIANSRGVAASAAVGTVEKIIIFLFLVPSSFMSAISAITAQNVGADKHERAVKTVRLGILITMLYGAAVWGISQFIPDTIISVFTHDPKVVEYGAQYLRSYTIDCMMCGLTFCLNGYLCGCGKSIVTFVHNTISSFVVRIPLVYILSSAFPQTLFPMGFGAPIGSAVSAVILIVYIMTARKKGLLR